MICVLSQSPLPQLDSTTEPSLPADLPAAARAEHLLSSLRDARRQSEAHPLPPGSVGPALFLQQSCSTTACRWSALTAQSSSSSDGACSYTLLEARGYLRCGCALCLLAKEEFVCRIGVTFSVITAWNRLPVSEIPLQVPGGGGEGHC